MTTRFSHLTGPRSLFAALLTGVFTLLVTPSLSAATRTWTGGSATSGNWSTAAALIGWFTIRW